MAKFINITKPNGFIVRAITDDIYVEDAEFSNNELNAGAELWVSTQGTFSIIYILNNKFSTTYPGGVHIKATGFKDLKINQCNFTTLGSLYLSDINNIILQNSILSQNIFPNDLEFIESIVNLKYIGNFLLQDVVVQNFNCYYGALNINGFVNIMLSDSIFINNRALVGGAIYVGGT